MPVSMTDVYFRIKEITGSQARPERITDKVPSITT